MISDSIADAGGKYNALLKTCRGQGNSKRDYQNSFNAVLPLPCGYYINQLFLLKLGGLWIEERNSQGDIYYAELGPVHGSEQGGHRPVLVISNAMGNKYSDTGIAAPITSQARMKAKLPTHIVVERFDGLPKRSIILLEQIRTLDKQRLGEYVGTLDKGLLLAVNFAAMISLEL